MLPFPLMGYHCQLIKQEDGVTAKIKRNDNVLKYMSLLGLDQAMISDRPPFVVSLNSKTIERLTKLHHVGGIEAIETRSFGRNEAIK